ncbi:MAG: hypothetical protein MUC67_12350 [Acidobacteria bacterium]|jgi:hypothetical protein|nr:hypothetical protein [Acidobacteriota bacterium]
MPTRYDFTDPEAIAYCPECGLGFRVAEGRCQDCDALLLTRGEALDEWRQSPPADAGQRSVFLHATATMVDTQLLRAQLESAGIGFVTSDMPQVWGPLLGRDAEVRFFVEERDLARALEVLVDVRPNELTGDAPD